MEELERFDLLLSRNSALRKVNGYPSPCGWFGRGMYMCLLQFVHPLHKSVTKYAANSPREWHPAVHFLRQTHTGSCPSIMPSELPHLSALSPSLAHHSIRLQSRIVAWPAMSLRSSWCYGFLTAHVTGTRDT